MKTSNKILIALLVVVFAAPLLIAATLKGKIKDNIYTVEKSKYYHEENLVSGSFTAYKVVKVIAPRPELLRCILTSSDKMNFTYNKETAKESVMVFTKNDTLFVQYDNKTTKAEKSSNGNWNNELTVRVNLPTLNSLVVDGAVVIVDSFQAASGNMSVVIKNRGELKDGSKKKPDEDVSKIAPANKVKDINVAKTTRVENAVFSASDKKFEAAKEAKGKSPRYDVREVLLYRLV
jgi:hypothetical protein